MPFAKLLTALFGRNRESASALDHLHSAAEFRRLLRRERARCDRSGEVFSVLTLTPDERSSQVAVQCHLAQVLPRRLRCIDDAGWLDENRIAILMPITSAEGACKVVPSLRASFPPQLPFPKCEVYTYPTEPWHDDPRALPPVQSETGRPGEPAMPVHAMQPIFCQALPLWKRALDVLVAGTALLLLTPLFALVALAIKITSPGPVLFRQLRSGLGGRRFFIYKFRSMRVDAEKLRQTLQKLNEQDGPAFKIRNDPRVTRLGRFLRSTSIDELPQLWNVLCGDMSLVGPRPLPCHESEACAPWQLRRLDVTPGLTCIWQVRGRCRVTFDEWMRMDLQYVASRSPIQDVKLILQTVPAVLARRGAT